MTVLEEKRRVRRVDTAGLIRLVRELVAPCACHTGQAEAECLEHPFDLGWLLDIALDDEQRAKYERAGGAA